MLSLRPRLSLVFSLLFTFSLASGVQAQHRGEGSIYSRFGIGELRTYVSSQGQGLGGGGLALGSSNYLNTGNPASFSDQFFTRLSAGMLYENLSAAEASQKTSRLVSSSLNALHASFPLLSNRLGVGLAFTPYSRVNFNVQTEGRLTSDASVQDSASYLVNFRGNGGLQRITTGLGYRLHPNVSVGASAEFIFGILEEQQETRFISSAYVPSLITKATRMFGVTATLGVRASLPRVFTKEDAMAIGVALTLPTTLDATRVQTLGEALAPDTLGGEIDGTASLPLGFSAGVAYQTGSKLTMVLDARYEPWSGFESSFSFPGYDPNAPTVFKDRTRLSGGVEFFPAGRDLSASYFKRVAYRLGVYIDQSYSSPNPGVDINTMALTGGFSFPTLLAGTRIDINMEVGRRGTTDQNLIRDTFYKLGFNLNFGERWFNQRKLR